MNKLLVYGANGYTGRLITEEALRRGLKPTLAGRNREAVEAVAKPQGLEFKAFGLDDPKQLALELAGFRTVLHCAGPFIRTAEKMARGCLSAGADYLDITGEIPVFETLFSLSEQAKTANVTLMPGVGFDIVPSDCLAKKLSEALPQADTLNLAFAPKGSISPGTMKTMLEFIHEGCTVRRNGKLQVLPKPLLLEVPFRDRTRICFSIPWGDVSTAYRTTGIPNITTYIYQKGGAGMQKVQPLLKILGLAPVRKLLQALVAKTVKGPDEKLRATSSVELWGQAVRGSQTVEFTLTTPDGYQLTAMTAVEIASRSLKREISSGFQTPALAFGSGFIETLPGVTLKPRTGPASQR